jgi:hypothetical protein
VVPEFPLHVEHLRAGESLFPAPIRDDEWILYHGTSGQFAPSIEEHGIQGDRGFITREQLRSVVDIFDAMEWAGVHGGGYAVLQPWSLNFDFAKAGTRKIYLAESSIRATTFASRDFAGGEAVRALSHALADLKRYIEDPDLRAEHISFQEVDAQQTGAAIVRPDVAWVAAQLATFNELLGLCATVRARHEFGVIYAVKFAPTDVPTLVGDASMGIVSTVPVRPEQLVAKMRVPSELECGGFDDRARVRAWHRPSGLLHELRNVAARRRQ